MKIISRVMHNGKVLYEIVESEGKNSIEFFPQETAKGYYQGREILLRLTKVIYGSQSGQLVLIWSATYYIPEVTQ